jgi:2-polyprenyl-3-methyl-5-hydroxy-6-metoxy-1,4-benzoquinol methylase
MTPPGSAAYAFFKAALAKTMFKKSVLENAAMLEALPGFFADAGDICTAALGYLRANHREADIETVVRKFYVNFVTAYVKEQMRFDVTGKYSNENSNFDEVNEAIYQNDHYMESYLVSLLVSYAFFPHHYAQYRFFARTIGALRPGANCIDFGCGHGYFSLRLVRDATRRCEGFDISPKAIEIARSLHAAAGQANRASLSRAGLREFTPELGPESYDFFNLCGFLEHLDSPTAFSEAMLKYLKNDGIMFIMLPINVPHPDHIVRIGDVAGLRDFLRLNRIRPVEEELVPTARTSVDEALRAKKPVLYLASAVKER